MKMTEISSANLRSLGTSFAAELKELGDKYGVDVRYAGGRYGTTSGEVRLKVNVQDTSAAETRAKTTYELNAARFGLDKSWFGKIVTIRGTRYRISGLNPNAPKYPVEAVRQPDGAGFRLMVHDVRASMSLIKSAA